MSKLPQRKNIRIKDYDYSQAGYYFITICTKARQKVLSYILEEEFNTISMIELTLIGNEIINTIEYINNKYSNAYIEKYVIMPNHIHFIIILHDSERDGQNLPLHKIIGRFKSYTNKRYNDINGTRNLILWQRNYYDHIIRNEQDYQEIYNYIETNPFKWTEDEYYI